MEARVLLRSQRSPAEDQPWATISHTHLKGPGPGLVAAWLVLGNSV